MDLSEREVGTIYEMQDKQRQEDQAYDFDIKLTLVRSVALNHPESVVYFYQFSNGRWYYLMDKTPDTIQCPERSCLRVTKHGAIFPVRLKQDKKRKLT